MNEPSNNTNAAFMEITSKKLETHDKKILAVEEKIKNIATDADFNKDIKSKIEALSKEVSVKFPIDKLNEFEKRLDNCISLLQIPKESKVQHHHHVPKIIWIAAGLFFTITLVGAGWFNTYNKLNEYIANDSKYRYLKLDTAKKSLQSYLFLIDSIYTTNADFRRNVLFSEQQNLKNFALLQKAYELKSEAKHLEKMVEKK